MNNHTIFSFPGNKRFAHHLANKLCLEEEFVVKRFPDGESYVRINSTVKDKVVISQ
jgi:ribose-phosphate pyrophosphokinase